MINFLVEMQQKFKLPFGEDFGQFKIIYIDSGAYIEGHRGIDFLSSEQISFKLKKGRISFFGNDLVIKQLEVDCAAVSGRIMKIERDE